MAKFIEPFTEEVTSYERWLRKRPKKVRVVAERFRPWELYRLKTTGQRVHVMAFGEEHDGRVTLRVRVSAQFNFEIFERDVFGINPDDLEPCDLPAPDELVGALLSPEQVDENIDTLRVLVRPDLWVMDANGRAVRKQ